MKKILLLGDYSGFNKNLKRGLEAHGVEVKLLSNGDIWKKIPGMDEILYVMDSDSNAIRKLNDRVIQPIIRSEKLCEYDVVQLIHEVIYEPIVNSYIVGKLKKQNGSLFVSACGNAYSVYKAWKNGLMDYYTFDDNPHKAERYTSHKLRDVIARRSEVYVDNLADGIIPMAYEYAVGLRNHKNSKPTIAAPVDLSELSYSPNIVKDKIVFYHGVTRSSDKGSEYISKAFDIIKEKYPNDVEMIIADRIPYVEYIKKIRKVNVAVDCCKELGWGINPCITMALGRVTMSCATEDSIKELGLEKTPIFHISPDVDQIVSQIETIIANKGKIEEWGYDSRKFVEINHDCVKVAEKYIKTWEGNE